MPVPIVILGNAFFFGEGVEVDKKKARHYYELAATGGIIDARYNLGVFEDEAGNVKKALKHYMISVKDGGKKALESIKSMYMFGDATKDDYAEALHSFQAYLDEIKSDQRDEAAKLSEVRYYESTS